MPKVQQLKTRTGASYLTTIPQEIVEALELEKGDLVEFVIISGEYQEGKLINPVVEFRKTKKMLLMK